MKKVLIVSDTHGNESWLDLVESNNYDFIIHAGDHLMKDEIMHITNYYVDGNNDWNQKNKMVFNIENLKCLLIHGDEVHLSGNDKEKITNKLIPLINEHNCDLLVFGHTHIPFINRYNNCVIINPGSMSLSRHNFKKCYAEMIIDNNKIVDIEFKEF